MNRNFAYHPLMLALALVLSPHLNATVTLDVNADRLNDNLGAATGINTLALFVVDTDGDGLDTAITGNLALNSFLDGAAGDDLIVFRTDLNGTGTAGVLQASATGLAFASDPNGKWGASDAVYLVWFPTLTISNTSLAANVFYGSVPLGITPADGDSEAFNYLSPVNTGAFGPGPVPGNASNTAANLISSPGPAPEIVVTGNGTQITDGSNNPSISNDTDFGSVAAAGTGSAIHTFTITNTGSLVLNIGTVTAGGDFSVQAAPTQRSYPREAERPRFRSSLIPPQPESAQLRSASERMTPTRIPSTSPSAVPA